ncbi:MAG: CDP-archaeol synthase [Candidatus Lokiarchaeota archaeon]|nr:CDP-archaeol synthase [Candidatus Lokiarchaeota archaeon]
MSTHNKNGDINRKDVRLAIFLTIFFISLLFFNFLVISIVFSWADWLATLIFSVLFIVPAYFSNAGMVIVGGGKPIDGGKFWRDGRRILGGHKTISGFVKGPLYIGIPLSCGLFLLFLLLWPAIQQIPIEGASTGVYVLYSEIFYYEYFFIGGPIPIGMLMIVFRIIFCSYGAAFGDLAGSFLKRRFNIKSGDPFWVVDQLDFAVGAIIFAIIPAIFFPALYLIPDINIIIFLLILTPSVSLIANTIAYLVNLKEVPW